MRLRTIAALAAVGVAGLLASACKCESAGNASDAPARPVGSATTGETLPGALVELTDRAIELDGKQVDTTDELEEQKRLLPLKGLAAALSPGDTLLKVYRYSPQLFTLAVMQTIGSATHGADLYLDTGHGVVRLSQKKPAGRTLVVLMQGERKISLVWEVPFGKVSDDKPVDIYRQLDLEKGEFVSLQDEIVRTWKKSAAGAQRVVIRADTSNAFREVAAAVFSADLARRKIRREPIAFEIGVAPLLPPPPPKPYVGTIRVRATRVLSGPRSEEDLHPTLRSAWAAWRQCYETAATKYPGLGGEITVRLTIDKSGKVTKAKASPAPEQAPELPGCLEQAAQRIEFEAAAKTTMAEVPIVLLPPGGPAPAD